MGLFSGLFRRSNGENDIIMSYPFQEGHDVFDGQEHRIKPIRLVECRDNLIAEASATCILEYFDHKLRSQMITLLARYQNGEFIKIPLYDYSTEFFDFCVSEFDFGNTLPVNVLPSKINTRQALTDFSRLIKGEEEFIPLKASRPRAILLVFSDNKGHQYITLEAARRLFANPVESVHYLPIKSLPKDAISSPNDSYVFISQEQLQQLSQEYELEYCRIEDIDLFIDSESQDSLLWESDARAIYGNIREDSSRIRDIKDAICISEEEQNHIENAHNGERLYVLDEKQRRLFSAYYSRHELYIKFKKKIIVYIDSEVQKYYVTNFAAQIAGITVIPGSFINIGDVMLCEITELDCKALCNNFKVELSTLPVPYTVDSMISDNNESYGNDVGPKGPTF